MGVAFQKAYLERIRFVADERLMRIFDVNGVEAVRVHMGAAFPAGETPFDCRRSDRLALEVVLNRRCGGATSILNSFGVVGQSHRRVDGRTRRPVRRVAATRPVVGDARDAAPPARRRRRPTALLPRPVEELVRRHAPDRLFRHGRPPLVRRRCHPRPPTRFRWSVFAKSHNWQFH